MSRTIGFRRGVTMLLALVALLAGTTSCAQRSSPDEETGRGDDPASAFPVRVELPGQDPVTLPEQPKRIVSLSPTATEVLYEIGAGEQVVAVDEYSTYPERAPREDISALNVGASTVSEYRPDLVIAQAGSAGELAKGLRELDIPVLLTPSATDLRAAYEQMKALGRATGHGDEAADTVRRIRSEIDELVRQAPDPEGSLTYYHEVSPDHFTATSKSFVGSVYEKFGLDNIADSAGGKFPQLSEERILRADPDMIFLADTKTAGVSEQAVSNRPGWQTLTAVREGHVYELNEDVASRWGPRVVELARSISEAIDDTRQS
ncbi:iron complex transport system substrate-binding protein [Actinopolyspora xinjiangensis]|uniref:Iron complex transport system substrate-binding protein n=1 Tax=Actinopolyspora xinjiangensis TaxID=405564 RepID=A0A1H0SN78_9ACTN|nr:ABC transporter substrate-binding protein [Actinopolyspora xinjiangensis]SDP43204.1 iron complex transport system substrate-binding protein [Actinopolyspora xinjiangensis]